jgi:hypothetical protein
VTVRGRYDLYYGAEQLVAPELVARAAGAPVVPVALSAADLGDAGALGRTFDSMLVRVDAVSVAATNPDAPSDYDETLLGGALRLDDLLYPELDNVFPPGTPFTRVTGILGRSFDHQKLWPRTAADLEP